MPMEKKAIPFILNPAAGGGRSLARLNFLLKQIKKLNLSPEIFISQSEAHLCQLTRELAPENEVLVGIGGDSTFHLMANEILQAGTKTSLAFIGLGSSNDIPREFGLLNLKNALLAIKKGRKRAIDVAAILVDGQIVRYVPGQVNIGLGATVNQYVASLIFRRPWLRRHQNLCGLLALSQAYKNKENSLPLAVETAKETYSGDFAIALFTNIRYWATGRKIAPLALPDDGLFDLCLIRACSLKSLLVLALLARKGRHARNRNILLSQSNYFRVRSEKKFYLQADGEMVKVSDSPLLIDYFDLKVIPRALEIIA
jgi:diacylglycerol kinase (ATP)